MSAKMLNSLHVLPTYILDTYQTFVMSATGYFNDRGERRLVCAVHRPGMPHEIKDVKWLRNGVAISGQNGFKFAGNDLLIEVSI